jgi:uncharacterized protein (TIGR03086 family)
MPTVIPDLRAQDAVAVRASVAIVAQITADDLGRPTPCAAWDLRALLAHMTVQHHGFAAAAEGNGADPAIWRPVTRTDRVGDLVGDLVADYARAADRVLEAFAGDVLDRPFVLGELGMTVPGRMGISFHFIDYVVHSWDVAAALGRPFALPDDILQAAVPVAESVPAGERRLRPGASFAPPIPDPSGDQSGSRSGDQSNSGALDHILRYLGRSPDFGK